MKQIFCFTIILLGLTFSHKL